ncbi:hypothetical protein DGI_1380 [Megalodesulfovibrio gigas DSM 1382 = ATCC 19364]|uniref:Uncharacterized protein n=1 Tax=Megalodesulfovibrio gigas (strain ATCC 19364 / DSM 1382 / NCIMB 9332 / VKM B-1759) TaxID=1121448 RepID=T2GAS7_MEGG1|nr:hypothetical protein DGI_1380 [Megalodesulfovibrio gigas DSM 1382 = ATCC 19364]
MQSAQDKASGQKAVFLHMIPAAKVTALRGFFPTQHRSPALRTEES